MKKKKILGVAGGMGPYATALFYQKLTLLTRAGSDAEHIECVIHSCPDIPDRTAYLTGTRDAFNPVKRLIEVCRNLEKMVDIIAIPCMTSHHFYDEISSSITAPVLDMQHICAQHISRMPAICSISKSTPALVGIMSTQGTIKSGRLHSILMEYGITPIFPIDDGIVTKLIYDVKAGKPLQPELFAYAVKELAGRGASVILLGCTELQVYTPLAHEYCNQVAANDDAYTTPFGAVTLLDSAELLAIRCIEECGGSVINK